MKARTQSYGSSHRVSSSIPAPAWHVSSFWPLAEQEQNTHRTVPASYNQYSCLKQMEAKQTASDIDCILWNYWLSYQDQDHRHTTSEAPCASFTSHLLPSWDSSSSHLYFVREVSWDRGTWARVTYVTSEHLPSLTSWPHTEISMSQHHRTAGSRCEVSVGKPSAPIEPGHSDTTLWPREQKAETSWHVLPMPTSFSATYAEAIEWGQKQRG